MSFPEVGAELISNARRILLGALAWRKTATDAARKESVESSARDLIGELKCLVSIASEESALDHQNFIREANDLVDAARELID